MHINTSITYIYKKIYTFSIYLILFLTQIYLLINNLKKPNALFPFKFKL